MSDVKSINPLLEVMYLPLRIDQSTYLRGCLRNYIRSIKVKHSEERDVLENLLKELEDSMFDVTKYNDYVF